MSVLSKFRWRCLPVMLAKTFLAALGPAEAAVRAKLVEALQYE
jgi:hypothetical protein